MHPSSVMLHARMQAEEPTAALTPVQSMSLSSPAGIYPSAWVQRRPGAPPGSRGDVYVWILGGELESKKKEKKNNKKKLIKPQMRRCLGFVSVPGARRAGELQTACTSLVLTVMSQ